MNVRFLEIVQTELDSTVEYYNSERTGLGYEFLREIFISIDRIIEYPEAWKPFYKGTRRCLIRRFPYGIIYKQLDDLILIFAIANLHRKPDYWIERRFN